MRIAVASDDRIAIAGHFGRCAGFLIFEAENDQVKELEFRANHFGHHQHGQHGHGHGEGPHQHGQYDHGEGHHSHEGFIGALKDCEVVICRGMGQRAVADLAANGIRPAIVAQDISPQEAATLYARGHLESTSDSSCCSH